MTRKYKQAYAILVAFVIVAAAYTCRMLAMYDIGGKSVSYTHLDVYKRQGCRKDKNTKKIAVGCGTGQQFFCTTYKNSRRK